MSIPTTRAEFKDYCLRALGKPVLQINVDDTQVEDRIDEAVYLYQQFHMDAVVKTYMKHRITSSTLRFAAAANGAFQNGESIVGATSGSIAIVDHYDPASNTSLLFHLGGSDPHTTIITDNSYSDTASTTGLLDGEVVTGNKSGATATIFTSNSSVSKHHAW
jgi:hypothetical protein